MPTAHAEIPTDLPGHLEWRMASEAANVVDLVAALKGPGLAEAMSVGERDRYLVGLFSDLYGAKVEAIRRCAGCRELYDIDFDLAELLESLADTPRPDCVVAVEEDGRARLRSGHRLRAPTRTDEIAVEAMEVSEAAVELLRRCCDETGAGSSLRTADAEAALEWLSPIVDVDLTGVCPECGTEESLRFSVEHYLLRSLAQERDRLLRETHLIAATYHWSFDSILGLGRNDRRRLATHVEDDRFATRSGGRR